MVLDYEDLNDADKAIIEELREGRNIPSNIANDLDYTREYVSSRLKRLREHEIAHNIGGGVHELVEANVPEDIAESGSSTDVDVTDHTEGATDTEAKEEIYGDLHDPAGDSEEVEDGDEGEDTLRAEMEAQLDEIHIKGRPDSVKRTRKEAAIYAWERLREEGEMRPSKLADDTLGEFFEDPNLNYSTSAGGHPGYQLLDNFLRETVRELPGVHPRGQTWQFREHEGETDE
jgi:hypothetical protein